MAGAGRCSGMSEAAKSHSWFLLSWCLHRAVNEECCCVAGWQQQWAAGVMGGSKELLGSAAGAEVGWEPQPCISLQGQVA